MKHKNTDDCAVKQVYEVKYEMTGESLIGIGYNEYVIGVNASSISPLWGRVIGLENVVDPCCRRMDA